MLFGMFQKCILILINSDKILKLFRYVCMEIIIPTSLDEITLAQYRQVEKDGNDITDELLLKIRVISILCNIPAEEVLKFKAIDLESVYTQLLQTLSQKPELVTSFTLSGVKFGFIPDLDKIGTPEYIDLNEYLEKDPQRALAVLYRPIVRESKELYSIEEYNGTDQYYELMADAPASAYISAMVFFYNLGKELLKHIPAYIQKHLTEAEATHLQQNGVGISQLMQSLETIELNIKKF